MDTPVNVRSRILKSNRRRGKKVRKQFEDYIRENTEVPGKKRGWEKWGTVKKDGTYLQKI